LGENREYWWNPREIPVKEEIKIIAEVESH
jgi:hypothetical protein